MAAAVSGTTRLLKAISSSKSDRATMPSTNRTTLAERTLVKSAKIAVAP
jgi:hypothetical protein